ncbi:ejaculatory bulb-specific protein 3-like [Aricia agestis]|uniref:ejaculatory bulb-specific protein 3-like n=1 Tax=Aricia agestis TaxID=91739 RepID=UPI001C20B2CD|nr:ejaculatory bulb-specific protein 3-like [Aricia agestis]
MKFLALFSVLIVVYGYTDVDNSFSYEDVAKNATELQHHLNCFLEIEPCSDVAAHYRSHIMDTLTTDCAYCTAQHKHNAKMFIHGVKKFFPDGYIAMKKKYDPEDKLFKPFEVDMEKF